MLLLGIGAKAASGQSRLSSRSPSPYRRGHRAGKPDLRLRWILALHRRGRFLGPLARSNESRYKARHRTVQVLWRTRCRSALKQALALILCG